MTQIQLPSGVGFVLAIVVLVLAILGMLAVLPFKAALVFGMLGLLAVARMLP